MRLASRLLPLLQRFTVNRLEGRVGVASVETARLPSKPGRRDRVRAMATRGEHLVRSDRRSSTAAALLGRLAGPAFAGARSAARAAGAGGIEATLPDGSRRRIGFPSAGPVADRHDPQLAGAGAAGHVRIRRLVSAWETGEWSSPDPVPLFDLFMLNGRAWGNRPGQGRQRVGSTHAHRCATMGPARRREHRRAL